MLARTSTGPEIDDHFGEKALQERSNWDLGPPSGQADTNHIRFLMIKARDSDGGGVFSDSEVSALSITVQSALFLP